MHWIAASETDTAAATLEKRLWEAADQFRANSGLKSQEYCEPVLVLASCASPSSILQPSAPSWRKSAQRIGESIANE